MELFNIFGAIFLVIGFYVFTRCGMLKIKNFINLNYGQSDKTKMLDMLSFVFGLTFMWIGYDLISSFVISVCILWLAGFIYYYLKSNLNYDI